MPRNFSPLPLTLKSLGELQERRTLSIVDSPKHGLVRLYFPAKRRCYRYARLFACASNMRIVGGSPRPRKPSPAADF